MAYATGSASSWSSLNGAISTFATVTLGTYTEDYNDGKELDNTSLPGTQLCLSHTLSGMKFFLDSGPMNSAGHGTGSKGVTGHSYILAWMSTSSDDAEPLYNQPGSNPGLQTSTAAGMQTAQSTVIHHIDFTSTITYHFFGDTPGTGGEDYFHIVLEFQENYFAHIWSGQTNSMVSEIPGPGNAYGGFIGTSGPKYFSGNNDFWTFPLSLDLTDPGKSILYFPEGTGTGQIETSGKGGTVAATFSSTSASPNTDWATNATATSGWSASNPISMGGRSSVSGRLGFDQPLVTVMDNGSGSFTGTFAIESNRGPGSGMHLRLLGSLPGAYTSSVAEVAAGEEVTVGSDTFKVFPLLRRDTVGSHRSHPDPEKSSVQPDVTPRTIASGNCFSGAWAIAYKK
jgi:hypothetical protein